MNRFHPRGDPSRPAAWSMDLLTQIWQQPLDPDYQVVHDHGGDRSHRREFAAVVLVLVTLVTFQTVRTLKAAPTLAVQRQELLARVQQAEQNNDELRSQQEATDREIRDLQSRLGDRQTQERIGQLAPAAGQQAVQGPGLTIVVDDAPDSDRSGSRVTDLDLRQLVNGLWQAGAEAIAINGHRLSARTAIRGAGSAITVDYRSLVAPYRVEVIGDPRTLEARFAETAGGAWWGDATKNYGLRLEATQTRSLLLPADPGLGVSRATPGGR